MEGLRTELGVLFSVFERVFLFESVLERYRAFKAFSFGESLKTGNQFEKVLESFSRISVLREHFENFEGIQF